MWYLSNANKTGLFAQKMSVRRMTSLCQKTKIEKHSLQLCFQNTLFWQPPVHKNLQTSCGWEKGIFWPPCLHLKSLVDSHEGWAKYQVNDVLLDLLFKMNRWVIIFMTVSFGVMLVCYGVYIILSLFSQLTFCGMCITHEWKAKWHI